MTTFRLATLNVHSFDKPLSYKNNIEQLVSILKPYNLDLIAVQETSMGGAWNKFCQLLSLSHQIFGPAEGSHFGNGIASRYPIKLYSNHPSDILYEGGRRSMLHCSLDGDHPFTKDRIFAVTHLDHMDENDRIAQIKEFNPLEKNIDILMGDMNALTRDDYSDSYYEQHIVRLRKQAEWEQPSSELTNLITKQWNFQDAFRQRNPHAKDQQVVTCRYKTRIDYIYLRPRLNDSWTLKECLIIDTQNATDHHAILAVFEQNKEQ